MSGACARALLVAAPKSGSGKTTLALGLMRAYARRGLKVAAAKSGPDYIDPAFHAAATGRPSVNLDSWAMPPDLVRRLAAGSAEGADLLLAEASMGLFDGVPAPLGRSGASADVAAALGMPVLLVLDVSGQAQSAAAIAKGCSTFDQRIEIAGIVLNKVGSSRHFRLAAEAIEALGIRVVGSLPRSGAIALPERHLGLVQAVETRELDARLDALAAFVSQHVDLDAIAALCAPLTCKASATAPVMNPPAQRIAVARDAAFSFFYPHILQSWRDSGAEMRFFSPLADEAPPADAEFCWLPGGYPELHAGRLSEAHVFRDGLRHFAETRCVHGECGGYMVLGESLTDAAGLAHRMTGLLSLETSFAVRKMTLGYRDARLADDGPLGRAGARFRGHEFHYATIVRCGDEACFASTCDAYGGSGEPSGSRRGSVTGSFFHVIAAAE